MSCFGVFLGSHAALQLCVRWEFHCTAFLSLPVESTCYVHRLKKLCSTLAGAAELMVSVSHKDLFSATHLKTEVPLGYTVSVGVLTLQSIEPLWKNYCLAP